MKNISDLVALLNVVQTDKGDWLADIVKVYVETIIQNETHLQQL
ncbi:hypothetical protein [Mucilaginibacter sp. JRF]|nr:hypothetical protein [Mucilaginibacter sp. JRF]